MRMMRVSEFCAEYGADERLVARLIGRGLIPCVQVHKARLVDADKAAEIVAGYGKHGNGCRYMSRTTLARETGLSPYILSKMEKAGWFSAASKCGHLIYDYVEV